MCNSAPEKNHHLWRCPSLLPHIRATFTQLASDADNIIRKEAINSLFVLLTPPSVEAILLTYVTHDLFRVFKAHLILTKTLKKHLWVSYLLHNHLSNQILYGNIDPRVGNNGNYLMVLPKIISKNIDRRVPYNDPIPQEQLKKTFDHVRIFEPVHDTIP